MLPTFWISPRQTLMRTYPLHPKKQACWTVQWCAMSSSKPSLRRRFAGRLHLNRNTTSSRASSPALSSDQEAISSRIALRQTQITNTGNPVLLPRKVTSVDSVQSRPKNGVLMEQLSPASSSVNHRDVTDDTIASELSRNHPQSAQPQQPISENLEPQSQK